MSESGYFYEKRVIRRRFLEMEGSEEGRKLGEPLSIGLFKAIQRFQKLANMIRLMWSEARRWSHVNFFFKITMQESIMDVKLNEVPLLGSNCGKKETDYGHFGNTRDCVHKVNAFDLYIAFCNKASLVPFDKDICTSFDLVDIFAPYGLLFGGNEVKFEYCYLARLVFQ